MDGRIPRVAFAMDGRIPHVAFAMDCRIPHVAFAKDGRDARVARRVQGSKSVSRLKKDLIIRNGQEGVFLPCLFEAGDAWWDRYHRHEI